MRTGARFRVDYALARRSVLLSYASGQTSRFEICDAHPDLIRAAHYCGEATSEACPVCSGGPLVLVSYVFSDEFPKRENGKVWTSRDVTPLLSYREVRLYTVEVCTDCHWNHVRSQSTLGNSESAKRRSARGRRVSR